MSSPRFLCIGGAMIDRKYELHGPLIGATSNPGRVSTSHGGVARNIAENLARLASKVTLAAAIGDDDAGNSIRKALEAINVDTGSLIVMQGEATAEYAAILASGTRDLALAVVAMDHAERRIADEIDRILMGAEAGMTVFADGNLPAVAMEKVIAAARSIGFFLAVDAVSIAKARRLPERFDGIGILFMNADEAADILHADVCNPAALAKSLVECGASRAVVTAGAMGAFAHDGFNASAAKALQARVVDVTGAGDSLVAATLWRLSLDETLAEAIRWGVLAAGLTIESDKSVLPEMSPGFLARNRWRIETE